MAEEINEQAAKPFDPREKRSIYDIIKDLSKPIPQKFLEKKQKGGRDIFFISWHNATKLLDHYANGWCFEVKAIDNVAGKINFTVRIGIPCLEGMVWRDSTGNEEEDKDSYGDAFTNSESQALRRAAAKFGLGRDLYPTTPISAQDYARIYPAKPAVAAPAPRAENQTPPKTADKAPQSAPAEKAPVDTKKEKNAEKAAKGAPKMANEGQQKALDQYTKQKGKSEIDVCLLYSDNRTEVFDQLTSDEAAAAITDLQKLPDAG